MTSEDAVRAYLLFLSDPSSVTDAAEVKRLEAKVKRTKDPVSQLKVAAELERAQDTSGTHVRKDFVRHARAWAEEHSVPVTAFQRLGVPEDVLADAGFEVDGARRPGRRPSRRAAKAPRSRGRSRRVGVEEIKVVALDYAEPFSVADLAKKVGASPATVRKAIDELIAAGQLASLGAMENYQGRGRAPQMFGQKPRRTGSRRARS